MVSNGQNANATNFNNAFASKIADNTLTGILELDNVTSGSTVINVQQKINDLIAADVAHDSDISNLQSDVSSLQADVSNLQSDVAALHNTKVEYRTISSGEFTAKQLTLVENPFTPTEVALDLKGGVAQFYTDDFIVTGAILDWTGLGLDGLIATGDKVRIIYIY